jgi:hypothetical protein
MEIYFRPKYKKELLLCSQYRSPLLEASSLRFDQIAYVSSCSSHNPTRESAMTIQDIVKNTRLSYLQLRRLPIIMPDETAVDDRDWTLPFEPLKQAS